MKKLGPYTAVKDEGQRIETRVPTYLDGLIKNATAKKTKIGFETGIRACYVAKRECFDMGSRRSMRLMFRQYAAPNSNELERFNSTQADALSSNLFQSFFMLSPATVIRLSNRMLEEFRERAFYYLPLRHHISGYIPWPFSPFIFPKYFHHHTYILNVEELATLWHFPGQTLKVPTLERIESKEASPPTNLPT